MKMRFSERYGYRKVEDALAKEKVPQFLRTRIWNALYEHGIFDISYTRSHLGNFKNDQFVKSLWDSFFKQPLDVFDKYFARQIRDTIRDLFFKLPWYEIYDFIEFFAQFPWDPLRIINKVQVIHKLNKVLEEERAPYRIVNDEVVPLTSNEEIEEIEKALKAPSKFQPVKDHLKKALRLFSDRKEPDYANSIKESISALESLVQILQEKRGTLGKLIDELNVHPALKEGFKKLYGWTSDEEGVRHGKFSEPLELGYSEARYMLISVSAFINYLIDKFAGENDAGGV